MRFLFHVQSDETQSSMTGLIHIICDNLDRNHTGMSVAACVFLFVMVAINQPTYFFCSPTPDVSLASVLWSLWEYFSHKYFFEKQNTAVNLSTVDQPCSA